MKCRRGANLMKFAFGFFLSQLDSDIKDLVSFVSLFL